MIQAYVLVLVLLFPTPEQLGVGAKHMGIFKTNVDCFKARETLGPALFETAPGYFPKNAQAICVPLEYTPETKMGL